MGLAGALLMMLPPVSAPSLAMVTRSFRPQVLVFVAVAIVAFGILAGLLAVALKF